MSAISIVLLVTAATATALGGAALYTARGLNQQLTAVRRQLDGTAPVPPPRQTPAEEIRAAVTDALAEERERELAEARAFWAAQEARDAGADPGTLLAGHGTEYEIVPDPDGTLLEALLEGRLDGLEGLHGPLEGEVFVPRQTDPDGVRDGARDEEARTDADADARTNGTEPDHDPEGAEVAAARRRHPSHPDFNLNGDPVVPAPTPPGGPVLAEHERTVRRLTELAEARTPLAEVRPGPLGTLDVYAFEDGTTLCMSPGHRDTALHLAQALDGGLPPVLLGGSSVSGAYALTFAVGDELVYTLADRVIASL